MPIYEYGCRDCRKRSSVFVRSMNMAAQAYEERHEELPPGRRIDVIAVDLDADGELLSVEHIESAIEEG